MKKTNYLALLLLSSLPSYAQLAGPLEVLTNGVPLPTSPAGCEPGQPAATAGSCSALTDNYCRELWSPGHDGNLKTEDGQIRAGNSPVSGVSLTVLDDLRALVDGQERLPTDLRERLAPTLVRLRALLDSEQPGRTWATQVSQAQQEIASSIDEVANDRAEAAHPELRSVRADRFSVEQSAVYAQAGLDLNSAILEAKYKDRPVWQRVERVFGEARAAILEEIEAMPLSDEQKRDMRERVSSIQLTLPYQDPNRLSPMPGCDSTMNNAYYSPLPYNKFTVCAGLFNAYQSDATMLMVVAHEISHSIDPLRFANSTLDRTGRFAFVDRLKGTGPAPVVDCGEWQRLVGGAIGSSQVQPNLIPRPALSDCLISKEGLAPIEDADYVEKGLFYANLIMSDVASQNSFTRLAQETREEDGKTLPNGYFLNPARLEASSRGVFLDSSLRDPGIEDVFAQTYACLRAADPAKRQQNFKQAIESTQQFYGSFYADYFRSCGNNCSQLAMFGMGRDPSENFADWMASRARARLLAKVESAESRRNQAVLSTAFFCSEPSALTSAPDFTEIEKTFSTEPHPDSRVRRLSMFPPEITALAGCESTPQEQRFGACKP